MKTGGFASEEFKKPQEASHHGKNFPNALGSLIKSPPLSTGMTAVYSTPGTAASTNNWRKDRGPGFGTSVRAAQKLLWVPELGPGLVLTLSMTKVPQLILLATT